MIEKILQFSLVDEHDNYVTKSKDIKTGRLANMNWDMLLSMFDHARGQQPVLPPQELQAVFHFLCQSVPSFQPGNRHPAMTDGAIKNLLNSSKVFTIILDGGARNPYKDISQNGLLLYERGVKTDFFTLLLDGECEVFAGKQAFQSKLSRWSFLCPDALEHIAECYIEVNFFMCVFFIFYFLFFIFYFLFYVFGFSVLFFMFVFAIVRFFFVKTCVFLEVFFGILAEMWVLY